MREQILIWYTLEERQPEANQELLVYSYSPNMDCNVYTVEMVPPGQSKIMLSDKNLKILKWAYCKIPI